MLGSEISKGFTPQDTKYITESFVRHALGIMPSYKFQTRRRYCNLYHIQRSNNPDMEKFPKCEGTGQKSNRKS
jgi:hypothetical protein